MARLGSVRPMGAVVPGHLARALPIGFGAAFACLSSWARVAASANSGVNRWTPAVDRDVVDLDPTFGQQLLDVTIGQAVAQVPAHRHHDHIGRESEPGERGSIYLSCRPAP